MAVWQRLFIGGSEEGIREGLAGESNSHSLGSYNRASAGGCEALGCCTATCILVSQRDKRKEGRCREGGVEGSSIFTANPGKSHDPV